MTFRCKNLLQKMDNKISSSHYFYKLDNQLYHTCLRQSLYFNRMCSGIEILPKYFKSTSFASGLLL